MCNLYSITTNQAAIIALFRVVNRYVGNLAPMPGVFPDYKAPIVRNGAEGRELAAARWGMPSSQQAVMEATKKRASKLEANPALFECPKGHRSLVIYKTRRRTTRSETSSASGRRPLQFDPST